jgi:hypothetical protein
MTDDDMIIREAARRICAAQAWKHDSLASQNFLSGEYDQTSWVLLVEQGIRKGIEIGRSL